MHMKRASAGVGERDSRPGSGKSKENIHEGLKHCGGRGVASKSKCLGWRLEAWLQVLNGFLLLYYISRYLASSQTIDVVLETYH